MATTPKAKSTRKASTRTRTPKAATTPTTTDAGTPDVEITGAFRFPKDMTLLNEEGVETDYKAGDPVPEHIERQMKGLPTVTPAEAPDLGPVPGPGQAFAYETIAERI